MARFVLDGAPAMSVRWEFWDALSLRSGEGVCDIPVHFGDYIPEAVEAARRGPGSRGLDLEVAEVAKHQQPAEAVKREVRLGDGLEILILSAGAGLLGAVSALYYHWNGYHRKAKECWLIVSLSVVFHCLLAALLFA